jgi:hypothetical protein
MNSAGGGGRLRLIEQSGDAVVQWIRESERGLRLNPSRGGRRGRTLLAGERHVLRRHDLPDAVSLDPPVRPDQAPFPIGAIWTSRYRALASVGNSAPSSAQPTGDKLRSFIMLTLRQLHTLVGPPAIAWIDSPVNAARR